MGDENESKTTSVLLTELWEALPQTLETAHEEEVGGGRTLNPKFFWNIEYMSSAVTEPRAEGKFGSPQPQR